MPWRIKVEHRDTSGNFMLLWMLSIVRFNVTAFTVTKWNGIRCQIFSPSVVHIFVVFYHEYRCMVTYGGGVVASFLVHQTMDCSVWVWAQAGVFLSCSWARHYSNLHLFIQVYKSLQGSLLFYACNPVMGHHPISNFPSCFMLQKNWVDHSGYWIEADLTFCSCTQKKF